MVGPPCDLKHSYTWYCVSIKSSHFGSRFDILLLGSCETYFLMFFPKVRQCFYNKNQEDKYFNGFQATQELTHQFDLSFCKSMKSRNAIQDVLTRVDGAKQVPPISFVSSGWQRLGAGVRYQARFESIRLGHLGNWKRLIRHVHKCVAKTQVSPQFSWQALRDVVIPTFEV